MKFPDPWFEQAYIKQGRDFEKQSRDAALKYVTEWYCAVDGGAHVGVWSKALCNHFSSVVAFEPCPENYQYLTDNLAGRTNLTCLQYALGDTVGWASMKPGPGDDPNQNSGQWHLTDGNDVRVMLLDAFKLQGVGFIKLDVEGYEYFALKGAESTIKRDRPVILIEENGLCKRYGIKDGQAGDYLKALGYNLKERIFRDEVWVYG